MESHPVCRKVVLEGPRGLWPRPHCGQGHVCEASHSVLPSEETTVLGQEAHEPWEGQREVSGFSASRDVAPREGRGQTAATVQAWEQLGWGSCPGFGTLGSPLTWPLAPE